MSGTPVLLLLLMAVAANAIAADSEAASAEKAIGDVCEGSDGARGACRPIAECPAAHHGLRHGARPAVCFYDGFTPVVCCPGASPGVPPPTPAPAAAAAASERVATRMCNKYAEAVFRYETHHLGGEMKLDQCAMYMPSAIVETERVEKNEFPHLALLGYVDEEELSWNCGGALISERFVLTAAHCLSSRIGIPKIVRLGEHDLNTTDERHQHEDYEVEQAILHPDFKNSVYYNDIALLRLAKDVAFKASIRPACLNAQKEIDARRTTVSGWGPGDWAVREMSTKLRKAYIPVRETEYCRQAYKTLATTFRLSNGISEESMVCAGDERGSQNVCKSDSGGPLQVALRYPYCMYSVVGVTSFGKGTCTPPSVYTRVSHYVPWIESVVWPNEK